MKIEEINIDGFGKFHKYHCQTSGKLEVFYGKNESGKTTLRKFMIAMLFGLEKSRGLAARYDDFTRYQPVNGGIYGGSMIFEKDGNVLSVAYSEGVLTLLIIAGASA